jgi:hypothetical protein
MKYLPSDDQEYAIVCSIKLPQISTFMETYICATFVKSDISETGICRVHYHFD